MDKLLFTIGPTEMYETTKEVRKNGIPYFRNAEFSAVMLDTDRMLKECMKTSQDSSTVYLTASGTAGLEAVVDNLIGPEDRVLVIAGGGFGKRFAQICEVKGLQHDDITLQQDEELNWGHFEPYTDGDYKAVLVNLHETSTGQLYDISLLRRFCEGRNTLLIVDAISTFLCDPYDMDGWGIDVTIISTQKGLCVSPGMCMIVMNEKVVKNHLKPSDQMTSLYFDFNDYLVNMVRGQTPYTPAVGIVYEINDMLRDITEKGLDAKLDEVRNRAVLFRENIVDDGISYPEFRISNAITTVIFEKPLAKEIERELIDRHGFVINPCGGEVGEYRFRVSHVGSLSEEATLKLAEAIKEIYREKSR